MGWTRFLIAAALIPLAALAVISPRLAADPYGVWRPPVSDTARQVNMRYAKQRWLEGNCGDYGGFVFGNSRATGYDVSALQDIYGTRFYNMTIPSESWRGVEVRANWVMDHCSPRVFLITLGPGARRYRFYSKDYARLEPPVFTGREAWRYKLDYLRAPVSAILHDPTVGPRGYVFEPDTGHWRYPTAEAARRRGKGFSRATRCAESPDGRDFNARRYRRQIGAMRRLQARAQKQDVRLIWVVNPLGASVLDKQGESLYLKWTRAMLEQTGEMVFLGGYNDYTTDPVNYWDASHFRPATAGPFLRRALESRNDAMTGVWTAGHEDALTADIAETYRIRAAACESRTGRRARPNRGAR